MAACRRLRSRALQQGTQPARGGQQNSAKDSTCSTVSAKRSTDTIGSLQDSVAACSNHWQTRPFLTIYLLLYTTTAC